MTENQKKIAIIGCVIIVALLLFFRKSGNTVINQILAPAINVNTPNFDLPDRPGYPITIPGLPKYNPYQISPVSPCQCNKAKPQEQGTTVTNVYTRGSTVPISNGCSQFTPQYSCYIGYDGLPHLGIAPWDR